jgi:RNA polymerase sigma-70 factor (ECF subfamily)
LGNRAWRVASRPARDTFGTTRGRALRSCALDDILYVMPEPTKAQYGQLRRFVRRRMPSREAADDITQEIYASMADALADSSRESPRTLGWLYSVARRRIIDEARRSARADIVSLEVVSDPEAVAADYGPHVARTLSAGLARLSEAHRTLVVLRLLRGEGFAAIAKRIGVSEEACRMRFMRALEDLREEFEKEGLTP